MSINRFEFEDVRQMSNGLSHILTNYPDYDVRKVKNSPEYVVFYGDEEIGRWDLWGNKVLTMLWGKDTQKVYHKSPEAALIWLLDSHVPFCSENDFNYVSLSM